MRSHIEMRAQQNIEAGMGPEEARFAALRQFGWAESIKETCREQRGVTWLENLAQDIRYGARQLRKNPGFTAVAVLTLALAIGANTAIFTVVNALLLRSLPVRNPEDLVQVVTRSRSSDVNSFSYPFYKMLRDDGRSLSGLFAAGGVGERDQLIVPGAGNPETEFVHGQAVSGNFFSVLGVPAIFGRTFTPTDDKAGDSQAVVVFSHGFWERRFAADPTVIGKAISFKGIPFTIVGVTPPGFFGFQPGDNPDLWWPLQMGPQIDRDPAGWRLKEGTTWLRLMGRLSPGVERRQAEAELAVIYERYRDEFAASRAANWSAEARRSYFAQKLELLPGHAGWTNLRQQFRRPLLILMTVVALVLLIACANVASLLLARAAARAREFSVRSALGAGRMRLVRQLLTESVLLATLGGVLGLLFAQGGTHVLLAFMQLKSNPVSFSVTPDLRVLLFTTAAALLTGILFGLVPALRSSRIDLTSALKGTAGSVAGNASRQRLNQALVVTQVALSLALLAGAGLFVRTLRNLKGMDMGFNRKNVVQFDIDFVQRIDSKQRTALYQELLLRLEALPGVHAASLYGFGLLSGNGWSDRVLAEGYVATPGEDLSCQGMWVGPKFFETLGMKILSGRDFTQQDKRAADITNGAAPRVAVINEAMARRYFGDAMPLGRRFYFPDRAERKSQTWNAGVTFEIVGVVKDAKYHSLRQESPPTFYAPLSQDTAQGMTVAVRVKDHSRASAIVVVFQRIVGEVFAGARVLNVKTMDEVVDASVHQERVVAQLGGFLSIFALVLACLGLYGVLSFAVVQRTREIGVRVALGAQQRNILSLVVGQGVKLAFAGAAVGIAGALAATRLLSSLLFGVSPTDPLTFLGVSLLLLLVAILASWLPARRAAKVDPMEALRCE
ncbi:MAG: ABC transporter permease [Verrucomicrobia bacterium]|nr:ABC transporter permease [Verrucomicrobiota bacterium]